MGNNKNKSNLVPVLRLLKIKQEARYENKYHLLLTLASHLNYYMMLRFLRMWPWDRRDAIV